MNTGDKYCSTCSRTLLWRSTRLDSLQLSLVQYKYYLYYVPGTSRGLVVECVKSEDANTVLDPSWNWIANHTNEVRLVLMYA